MAKCFIVCVAPSLRAGQGIGHLYRVVVIILNSGGPSL